MSEKDMRTLRLRFNRPKGKVQGYYVLSLHEQCADEDEQNIWEDELLPGPVQLSVMPEDMVEIDFVDPEFNLNYRVDFQALCDNMDALVDLGLAQRLILGLPVESVTDAMEHDDE